ncbi:MAG: DUF4112 domain-containing protein [Dermatophilus congolensis]|nr:DUF4112 domain-containing protein [Dermatophilus congolensis]
MADTAVNDEAEMRVSTYIRGAGDQGPSRYDSPEYRVPSNRARTDDGTQPQDSLPGEPTHSGSTAWTGHGPDATAPDASARGGYGQHGYGQHAIADEPYVGRHERPVSGTVQPAGVVDSQSLSALAWLLDDLVRIPGLNVRIGLDAAIGLVPGIGDSIGTALSSVILVSSVRYRVPMHVLLQMAWNILVDTVLGLVPGVGDVADAVHRANRKNYRLLRETVESGKQVDASAKGYVLRAGLLVAGIIAAMVAATIFTLWIIFQSLGALFA